MAIVTIDDCRWFGVGWFVRNAPLGGSRSPRFFTRKGYDHFFPSDDRFACVCIGEMLRVGESRSSLDPRVSDTTERKISALTRQAINEEEDSGR